MTLRLFLLILASVSLSALAQLALKIGTTAAIGTRSAGIGGEMGSLAQSPMIIVGLGLYGVGALLWLFVLGRVPLSFAYPFVGMGFILTMLAGAFWLNESLSFARIAGTLLIATGCVLVARSA
ncbi:SMR family transporter [Stakelama sediminis]|nr:EamA family transporter [Stakelama sediminis]